MSKNIVLLSDGTGNAASKVWRTNVWRLFQSLDLTTPQQVACYDDGVGTSSFKPLAILGGAFGWGLKRNVLDLYKFLCRNYVPGADIYVFGFSRGAFTVRVLMGLVNNQGLVNSSQESELARKAKAAYRTYRRERYHSLFRIERLFRGVRDFLVGVVDRVRGLKPYDKSENRVVPAIRFIGVWDTVAAYGLPIEEMTRGVSLLLWPLELPDRSLNVKVQRACHALALDDERTTFHPVLWTEAGEILPQPRADGFRYVQDERISQVWFPGVHSNVGGGYPDDSLAHVALSWMMTEAAACGLQLKKAPKDDPDALRFAASASDRDGRLYDPRQGLGGYYRYGPRKIADLSNMRFSRVKDDAVAIATPKIHESAISRGINGAHVYAPIGLPPSYAVVKDNGQIVDGVSNPFESPQRAKRRADSQESIWNLVWKRRVVYFATVTASMNLALFPLIYQTDRAAEFSTPIRLVSETIRLAGAFIPGFFNWWVHAYATNPGSFVVGIAVLAGLIMAGSRLGGQITDQMRFLWRSDEKDLTGLPDDWIFRLRTNAVYTWTIWALKRYVVPFASVALILYVALTVLSHLLFNIGDSAGLYCRETATPYRLGWVEKKEIAEPFKVNDMCWASGIELVEGQRYLVTIVQTVPWKDKSYDVSVAGLEIGELPNWYDRVFMSTFVPLRRVFLRPWFRPIARIGSQGTDEYFLDPDKPNSLRQPKPDELDVAFRARRSGELFLYVNDATIGIPGLADLLYRNNSGEARVSVQHLSR